MTVIELGVVLLGVIGGGLVGHRVGGFWGTFIGAIIGYGALVLMSWLAERLPDRKP